MEAIEEASASEEQRDEFLEYFCPNLEFYFQWKDSDESREQYSSSQQRMIEILGLLSSLRAKLDEDDPLERSFLYHSGRFDPERYGNWVNDLSCYIIPLCSEAIEQFPFDHRKRDPAILHIVGSVVVGATRYLGFKRAYSPTSKLSRLVRRILAILGIERSQDLRELFRAAD